MLHCFVCNVGPALETRFLALIVLGEARDLRLSVFCDYRIRRHML